jgi:uncharacterized phage infection (PIP) family protein YhgE
VTTANSAAGASPEVAAHLAHVTEAQHQLDDELTHVAEAQHQLDDELTQVAEAQRRLDEELSRAAGLRRELEQARHTVADKVGEIYSELAGMVALDAERTSAPADR